MTSDVKHTGVWRGGWRRRPRDGDPERLATLVRRGRLKAGILGFFGPIHE